jgi:hypothetical protein
MLKSRPPAIDLELLRVFAFIAEERSFSRATRLVGRSLSAVFKRMQPHDARGTTGKGHQQNTAGIHAVDDQIGDPMGQGICLARPRSSDDKERRCQVTDVLGADTMIYGPTLLGI